MAKKRGAHQAELLRQLDANTRPACFLSHDNRIVYANPAFFEWLGIAPEQLEGVAFDRPVDDSISDALAELIPPASVHAGVSTLASVRLPGSSSEQAVRFIPCGAVDAPEQLVLAILATPQDRLAQSVDVDTRVLEEELRQLRRRVPNFGDLVPLLGDSPRIRRARDRVALAADSNGNCLLCGSPGSGGRLIARSIHAASAHATTPFLIVEASLMDAELLEVTLAHAIETLQEDANATFSCLLADVDEMEHSAQMTLRNLLQAHRHQIRCFATARSDLTQLPADAFDPDLAYQLTSIVIAIPDLAERPEDVKRMIAYLLGVRQRSGNKTIAFSREALDQMARYPWPGQFTELDAAVRHATGACRSGTVEVAHLPLHIRTYDPAGGLQTEDEPIQLDAFLLSIERELIRRALKKAKGNRALAARDLGITRSRLLRRISDDEPERDER